MHTGKDL
jgi:hypothetical protein